MGIFSRFARNKPEVQTAPTEAPKKFDIDAALNTPGFSEFLAQHEGADQMDLSEQSASEIEKRFGVFMEMKAVSTPLKLLYREEIANRLGVSLEAAEYGDIDEYLTAQALENPEAIAKLGQELRHREELKQKLVEREAKLATLKQQMGPDYLKVKENLGLAIGTRGFWNKKNIPVLGWLFRNKAENEARKIVKEGYKKDLEGAKKLLKQIENGELALNQAEAALTDTRDQFNNTYVMLFEAVEAGEALIAKAREKAVSDLKALAGSGDPKALEQALKRYQELKEGQFDAGFKDLTEDLDEDFGEKLDQALKDKAFAEAKAAIDAANETTLAGLEKVLKKLTERKAVGLATTPAEMKAFVQETLSKLAETASGTKKILLNRLKVKLA